MRDDGWTSGEVIYVYFSLRNRCALVCRIVAIIIFAVRWHNWGANLIIITDSGQFNSWNCHGVLRHDQHEIWDERVVGVLSRDDIR